MVKPFTIKDERIVTLLQDLDIPKNLACIIVFFSRNNKCICSDIQKVTQLRQPEVSTAMQYLRERNWVVTEPIRREEKGRPMITYKLTVPFERIILTIIREEKAKIKELKKKITTLRSLIK